MLTLIKLAWRNVQRNKRRTILTMLAVTITVICLTFAQSYFNGVLEGMYNNLIKTEIGHIRIADQRYLSRERMNPLEFAIPNYEQIEQAVALVPGVVRSLPRLKFGVLLEHEGNNQIAIGIGIDPAKEKGQLLILNNIIKGRPIHSDAQEVLLGRGLANKLRLQIGDSLLVIARTIYYSMDAMEFRVAGIFDTGLSALDDKHFYIPLTIAQYLLNAEKSASTILVMIKHPNKAIEIANTINNKLQNNKDISNGIVAVPWQHHSLVRDMVPYMKSVSISLFSIILFIAALVIVNTLLMAVMERTHEIGIMMAMGMKGHFIISLFLIEALIIAVLGGTLGGILGSGISIWTETQGIDVSAAMGNIKLSLPVMSTIIHPDFTIQSLIKAFVFGIITALVATIYPCIKALRLEPTEAIQRL